MLKAVIFDRDGVIVDSEYANVTAGFMAFQQLGIEIDEDDKKQIIGKHPKDYLTYFHTKYNFSDEEFQKIVAPIYSNLLEKMPFIPKAIDLCHSIKNKVLLALNTSSELKNTQGLLKRGNIENLFDALTTEEDITNRKPHPDSYLLTAQRLGVAPGECIAIEDSDIGLAAAKAAGMKCIIIPTTYTKDQDFSQADLVVDSADKLNINILRKIAA
ncbi:MAG: hypothetical protein CO170_03480 [candidate division SR1 bacterium CG_4_9_14_3_um_filter_40_9]|nr:MAG: hypothetical protein CO170_03480 [candidate division SR1 bacterium CG_4_9_14_3_um_filter_40_9]